MKVYEVRRITCASDAVVNRFATESEAVKFANSIGNSSDAVYYIKVTRRAA